jgi:NAD(P)-dependent dehydrogenase (short-subunit alcohol dehydrogenase family)
VKSLHASGAKVVFGDFDAKAGEAAAKGCAPDTHFLKTDVSSYADNLALFKLAVEKYGRVDHAIAVAGVGERGDWFGDQLTCEDVEKPESEMTLKVNLLGVLYFVRIALPYLRKGRKDGEDKGVVLVGSAAGIRESPGLPVYQACLSLVPETWNAGILIVDSQLSTASKGSSARSGNRFMKRRKFASTSCVPT